MAYVPTVWENDITEVDEDNMNHIEQGIKDNDDKLQGTTSMGNIVVDSIRSKNMWTPLLLGNQYNCSVSLSGDTYTFSATGSDMFLGNILTTSGTAYTNASGLLIAVKPNTDYTLSLSNSAFSKNYITYYNSSKLSISYQKYESNSFTFTTPNNCYYVSFRIGNENSVNGNTYSTNIQLELGSATPYSPFQDLNNQQVYSTSEVIIGTWIDGKPLYRRVIVGTSINVDNTQTTLITIPNISECFIENASVINTSTGYTIAMLSYNPDNTAQGYRVWVDANSGFVKYQIKNAATGVDKIRIILCYTKTTD